MSDDPDPRLSAEIIDETAAPVEVPEEPEESCDWSAPALTPKATVDAPSSQDGALRTVVVGAWQHTHYDSGSGYKPVDNEDIRYVFPSSERILYCQHVPGITDHAERVSTFSWDENTMVLPGGGPRFTVTEWSAETMVWVNAMDSSRYLLRRR